MKKLLYLTVALLLLSTQLMAQDTTVTFGRHGACKTGRGICAIETSVRNDSGNAELVKYGGNIVLQIYTERLTNHEKSRLTESIINSPVGYLTIEKGFEFGEILIEKLVQMGSVITEMAARNYRIEQSPGKVEIHLSKL